MASASVVSSFSLSSSSIFEGNTVTETLSLLLSPDFNDFNAVFSGGVVSLSSGYGPSQTFSISSGGNNQTFSATFAYAGAGTFTPSFSYSASYAEQYQSYDFLYNSSYYVPSGYYRYYSCGFSQCSEWIDTSYWQSYPVYGYVTHSTTASTGGNGALGLTVASPVPESSTWAMMILGFCGLGLVMRHRKKAAGVRFV
jgi:hypothetical protein